jgi:para-nitrobenzyl esterase
MNAVANILLGKVRGSIDDGVQSFKGIPYASPPFGANRLRPPLPLEPWGGVRDALTYGPTAPQPSVPPSVAALIPNPAMPGEDCLKLIACFGPRKS